MLSVNSCKLGMNVLNKNSLETWVRSIGNMLSTNAYLRIGVRSADFYKVFF